MPSCVAQSGAQRTSGLCGASQVERRRPPSPALRPSGSAAAAPPPPARRAATPHTGRRRRAPARARSASAGAPKGSRPRQPRPREQRHSPKRAPQPVGHARPSFVLLKAGASAAEAAGPLVVVDLRGLCEAASRGGTLAQDDICCPEGWQGEGAEIYRRQLISVSAVAAHLRLRACPVCREP